MSKFNLDQKEVEILVSLEHNEWESIEDVKQSISRYKELPENQFSDFPDLSANKDFAQEVNRKLKETIDNLRKILSQKCTHKSLKLSQRIFKDGKPHYVNQCSKCGEQVGSPVSKNKITLTQEIIPDFEENQNRVQKQKDQVLSYQHDLENLRIKINEFIISEEQVTSDMPDVLLKSEFRQLQEKIDKVLESVDLEMADILLKSKLTEINHQLFQSPSTEPIFQDEPQLKT